MARPSKLTTSQCEKARELRQNYPKRWTVAKLAKRFNVSESSMYKVFDGSYIAREDTPKIQEVKPLRPHGVTPSIFKRHAANDRDIAMEDVDELTLRAAQLIVARSRFARALSTH